MSQRLNQNGQARGLGSFLHVMKKMCKCESDALSTRKNREVISKIDVRHDATTTGIRRAAISTFAYLERDKVSRVVGIRTWELRLSACERGTVSIDGRAVLLDQLGTPIAWQRSGLIVMYPYLDEVTQL